MTERDSSRPAAGPPKAARPDLGPRGAIRRSGIMNRLPRSPLLRRVLGVLFLVGGILGFLPILGFWMIPIGLALLGADSPRMRRLSRRLAVRWGRMRRAWSQALRSRGQGTRKAPGSERGPAGERTEGSAGRRSRDRNAGDRRP